MRETILNYKHWIILLSVATVGALIGWSTGFPIGAMLGALIIVALTQWKRMYVDHVPIKIRRVIQVLIGSSLGLTFTSDTLSVIPDILFIALLMPLCHILLAILLSFLIFKMLKIDLITVLCSMAPAGIAEMSIISEKYGALLPTVVTIHVYRLIVIISIIPPLIIYGI